MAFVYILGVIYALAGFVYALYILLNGIDPWYVFPINFIGGPIVLLRNYYVFIIKKRRPR